MSQIGLLEDVMKLFVCCLSVVSWRRLKVILFLDTNMLFHPKLMFCDESATQLFLVACTRLYTSLCWSVGQSVITSCFWAFRAFRVFLRKNFLPKCFKKRLKSGFSTPQNTKCKMQDSKCKMQNTFPVFPNVCYE